MLDGIGNVLDSFRKFTPVPLLAIGIGTGAILFVPEFVAEKTGAAEFRGLYRGYLGLAFYIAWAFLFAIVCASSAKKGIATVGVLRARRSARLYLHQLSNQEKGYLRLYIDRDCISLKYPIGDGVVVGLMKQGILTQGSAVDDILEGCSWNIQSWARAYLKQRPNLLEGSISPPVPDRRGHF